MSKVILKVEVDEEAYKQIKGDSVCSNNNGCIISKSSSAYYALNAMINATPLTENDDAVSRQAVLKINENHHGKMPNHINFEIWNEIKALPSALPKREQGRWIKGEPWSVGCGMGETYGYYYTCSKCEKLVQGDYKTCDMKYCPNCGAKMR